MTSLKTERGNYISQADWHKRHNVRYELKVYRATETDILEKLESVDNVTDYIRRLIRADIARDNKEGASNMQKAIWIARTSDGSSDSYDAFFDRDKAVSHAGYLFDHLTSWEKKTHTVSLEEYIADVSPDDSRSAKELFEDMLRDDAPELNDSESYEMFGEAEFSGGQSRHGGQAVNYMLVSIGDTELYAEEDIPSDLDPDDMNTFDDESYERLKAEILKGKMA